MEVCKLCNGDRFVSIPEERWPPDVFMPVEACPGCTKKSDHDKEAMARRLFLNRAWPGLSKVEPSRAGVFKRSHLRKNLRIQSNHADLRAHMARLGRVLYRKQPGFCLRVCSDIDLLTSWLYSAVDDISDPESLDALQRLGEADPIYRRLPDLIAPPNLLVLCLGLKMAPNKALPDVVLETLLAREHLDRPTWVVERLRDPLAGHYKCYSDSLAQTLQRWPVMVLSNKADPLDLPRSGTVALPAPPEPAPPSSANPVARKRVVQMPEVSKEGQRKPYKAPKRGGNR